MTRRLSWPIAQAPTSKETVPVVVPDGCVKAQIVGKGPERGLFAIKNFAKDEIMPLAYWGAIELKADVVQQAGADNKLSAFPGKLR